MIFLFWLCDDFVMEKKKKKKVSKKIKGKKLREK